MKNIAFTIEEQKKAKSICEVCGKIIPYLDSWCQDDTIYCFSCLPIEDINS